MSFAARLQGAFRRRRERFYYERVQPDVSLDAIYAALAPGLGSRGTGAALPALRGDVAEPEPLDR